MTRVETMRKLCKELFGDEDARPTAGRGAALKGRPAIVDILKDIIESAHQADSDLCGDQREFHLPRLRRVAAGLMQWFPLDYHDALLEAVDAWGDRLIKDDSK